MTTTNEFKQEIFAKGTTLAEMLAFGVKNGTDKLQSVINNTYCKQDADQLIEIINSLK